jgi:hypothetical protein
VGHRGLSDLTHTIRKFTLFLDLRSQISPGEVLGKFIWGFFSPGERSSATIEYKLQKHLYIMSIEIGRFENVARKRRGRRFASETRMPRQLSSRGAGLLWAILLVLHSGVSAQRFLGSSRLKKASDPVVFLRTGTVSLDPPPNNWCE